MSGTLDRQDFGAAGGRTGARHQISDQTIDVATDKEAQKILFGQRAR